MERFFQNKWTTNWVMACMMLLAAGLVFSRALLSVSSVAVALPLFFARADSKLRRGRLLACLLITLPVLLSVWWSEDKAEWWQALQVRIPLFTVMAGFAAVSLSRRQWLAVSAVYILAVTVGCIWSLTTYISDPHTIEAAYLKAKVLPTLADHDYVRFSWMAALAVLLCAANAGIVAQRAGKTAWYVLALFLVVYLHILAAKTGLLCLYASAAVWFLHLLLVRRRLRLAGLLLVIAVAVAATAYYALPTLRNRVQYVRYDFSLYSSQGSAPGYNDAARWLSVKAGYHLTTSHPLTGVGFGDIRRAVNGWHETYHPQSLSYERFLPACEWMVYGAGAGWPGIIIFTAGLCLLVYTTSRRTLLSVLLAVVACLPLITDDTLEGQLGVAILAFISFFAQALPVQTKTK